MPLSYGAQRLHIGLAVILLIVALFTVQCGGSAPVAEQPPAPAEEEQTAQEPASAEEPVAEEPAVEEPAVEEVAEAAEEPAAEAEKPFAGTELVLASMTDQYVTAFRALIPQFEEETSIKVTLDELGYVDLYQKLTEDFVGNTASYDLMTVDIVWSGEYAANGYTLPLDEFMERDKEELLLDDIMPVAWTLGEWEGQHWAYPLAGYANVLNYRKDVLEAVGLEPPKTQEELKAEAEQLTEPARISTVLPCSAPRGRPWPRTIWPGSSSTAARSWSFSAACSSTPRLAPPTTSGTSARRPSGPAMWP